MKRMLTKGLCLMLGWGPMIASGQELNFRAVAPRPASSSIPITINRPTPIDASTPIFRAKIQDDGGIVAPPETPVQAPRLMPKDAPRVNGSPADFTPPAPQLISPPPGSNGPPDASPNPGMVTTPGTTVVPHGMVVGSSPVSTSGCACSSSGFSVFDGLIVEDPVSACGDCGSCDDCSVGCGRRGCRHTCQPLERIHEFFSGCWCNTGCCDPRPGFWVRGEYLLWSFTQQRVPVLGTQAATVGQLPAGYGNTVIYDDQNLPSSIQNGLRVGLGFWFPRHNNWGLDASYFSFAGRTGEFSNFSPGNPTTGRPFFNVLNNQPDAQIVASNEGGPGLVPGSLVISTKTQLWGAEMNLRRKLCCGSNYWIDGLVGYRHLALSESFDIYENIGPRDNAAQTLVTDSFGVNNIFNGPQLGLEAEWRFRPRFTLGGSIKVAAGNMNQTVNIVGATTIITAPPIVRETQRGGLLAQPSNMGTHVVDRFVVVPEVGIKLGWDITQHWRFFAGYNVLMVSNVVRAGDQIDNNVNLSQAPFSRTAPIQPNGLNAPGTLTAGTPARPAVLFRTSEFWAQGVNFGLEYRY